MAKKKKMIVIISINELDAMIKSIISALLEAIEC